MQLPCVIVTKKKKSFQLWTQTTSVPILYFFPSSDVWRKLWVIQTGKRLIIFTLNSRQRWELSNLMLGRKSLFVSCKSGVVFCKKKWNAGYRSHPQPTSFLISCTALSSRATGFSHCQNIRIVNTQLDSVWHLSYIWDTVQGRQIHMDVGNRNLLLCTHSVTWAWKRTTKQNPDGQRPIWEQFCRRFCYIPLLWIKSTAIRQILCSMYGFDMNTCIGLFAI